MKHMVLLIGLMASISCYAQKKVTLYTASNGITYKIGDTVKLGFGKGINGRFLFVGMRVNKSPAGDKDSMADRSYSNTGVVIKKMRFEEVNDVQKMTFVIPSNGIFNYSLSIEDAIEAGEVKSGKNETSGIAGVADELFKLKKLLDMGALTQQEFDTQKRKLLERD